MRCGGRSVSLCCRSIGIGFNWVDWWGGKWNEGKEKSGGDHSGLADM